MRPVLRLTGAIAAGASVMMAIPCRIFIDSDTKPAARVPVSGGALCGWNSPFHPPGFLYHAALQNGDAHADGWPEPGTDTGAFAAPWNHAGLRSRGLLL